MLAIIPARSGSKGVVGKNIKDLGGKPLIAHTILAAIESRYVDKIIVSTDSQEIADVAVKYGAEVPFLRPLEISGDRAPILANYKYVIDRLSNDFGLSYEAFVALQPTSPFRNAADIDSAIKLFIENDPSSVISFTESNHPIEWTRIIDKHRKIKDIGIDVIQNRQEYNKTYHFNGAVYVYKTSLVSKMQMYDESSIAYIMSQERSLDIDTERDFLYAKFLYTNTDL